MTHKTIKVRSGAYFNYNNVEDHFYRIEDIAHALSNNCRYTGHCKHHYSIAQHSVLMSYQVPEALALEALLHDASEAYLGDLNTDLKSMLPEYKALERRVESTIASQYGIAYPLPPAVKEADLRMLMTEKAKLIPYSDIDVHYWPDAEPYHELKIRRWPIWYAKWRFLRRFKELTR